MNIQITAKFWPSTECCHFCGDIHDFDKPAIEFITKGVEDNLFICVNCFIKYNKIANEIKNAID